jgi:hypothetical protein
VQSTEQRNYVVCLKWGDKYSSEYVNKLYNMVQRNLTLPHEFVCFTENIDGIDPNIQTKPLPKTLPVTGWWFKPWMFSQETGLNGTVLFLDLDLVVFKNIDNLFTYKPGRFCIIRDFNRKFHNNWNRMNSSVFRFETKQHSKYYTEFYKHLQKYTRRYKGDQDFMYAVIRDFEFWPDEWIQSYKWEMRGRQHLKLINGKRNFVQPGKPNIQKQTSVAVFHGEPNMQECVDEWPHTNWF